VRVLAVALVLAGCKADKPEPPPPPVERVAPASAPSAAMPVIDGAKPLPRAKPGDDVASWCIDEPDAVDRVTAALRRDGWSDVHTRGTGARIGIAANKGKIRFSGSTGARDDRCAGTVVIATMVNLGELVIPPGEKLR
jgi:hypothetical protein